MDLMMKQDSVGMRQKWTQEQSEKQNKAEWERLALLMDRYVTLDLRTRGIE